VQAKNLLTQKNIEFEERKIGDGWTRSVPQIFLDDEYVGGFDKLKARLLPQAA
jgi:glutaredoxin